MILTCPQCATRYQTDAALFAPAGRKVRCAKCNHVWVQAAPPPEPELRAALEEEPPAPELPSQRTAYAPPVSSHDPHPHVYAPPVEKKSGTPFLPHVGVALGWLGLAAIVLLVGWSAATYRQQIATLWPQSSSLYAALGLKVNARGIDIRDVFQRVEKEDGQLVLAVSGSLFNITGRELTVPPVSVTLTDDDRRTLYQWSFSSGVDTLKPGQSVRFRTRLSSPPVGVRHLVVRLAGTNG